MQPPASLSPDARTTAARPSALPGSARRRILRAALALSMAGAAPAHADDTQHVGVELNRLVQGEDACSVQFVVQNGLRQAWKSLDLDVVVFDTDGIIVTRVAMQMAPLRAGKLAVREFDLAGIECSRVGRLLLNDTPGCEPADGASLDCVELLQPSSRTEAGFVK